MIRQFYSPQFVAFLLTGGIAAAINFGSRLIYNQWMGFSAAVILAYLTGMVTAFVLARLFVFTASSQSLRRSAGLFALVNIAGVAQTWAISMALAYYILPWLGVDLYAREIAHAVGVLSPVFVSYIGHKRWSFR